MGSKKIPGFASPEKADEKEFPYDAAAVIAYWSALVDKGRSLKVVKEVQDSRGNPRAIKNLADKWGPEATKHILGAREGMSSARDDVRAYWEGGAFVAFNSYVEHVLKVMDDTAEVMRSMSKLNLDVLETTVNTYNSGINFIGECAQALLSAAASVAQNLLNLVGATCSAILEALSKFVGAVTELMIARNRSMMGYAKTGIALKQAAINLRVPDPIPSSVGDSGNWKVGRR